MLDHSLGRPETINVVIAVEAVVVVVVLFGFVDNVNGGKFHVTKLTWFGS